MQSIFFLKTRICLSDWDTCLIPTLNLLVWQLQREASNLYCSAAKIALLLRVVARWNMNPFFNIPTSFLFLVLLHSYFLSFFFFFPPVLFPVPSSRPHYWRSSSKLLLCSHFNIVLWLERLLPLYDSLIIQTVYSEGFVCLLKDSLAYVQYLRSHATDKTYRSTWEKDWK